MNDEPLHFDAEPATADAPEGPRFPWPPAEDDSIPAAFGATWAGSSLRPRSFFRRLPPRESVLPSLAYYLPLGIAVAGAQLFWSTFGVGTGAEQDAVMPRADALEGFTPLLQFLFSPLILLLSLVVSAGVTHLLLRLFGGANRGFDATTRIFAYAYSPQALGVIPVVGSVAGFFWMVVVAIVGVREGHRTTTARAAAAVLIPVAIALVFLAIAAFVAVTGSLELPH